MKALQRLCDATCACGANEMPGAGRFATCSHGAAGRCVDAVVAPHLAQGDSPSWSSMDAIWEVLQYACNMPAICNNMQATCLQHVSDMQQHASNMQATCEPLQQAQAASSLGNLLGNPICGKSSAEGMSPFHLTTPVNLTKQLSRLTVVPSLSL